MGKKIIISVILPTYNESGNIIALIQSIKKSLINYTAEIIVVDDNSPDNTGKIVQKKFSGDNNIKVYIRTERGLAGAVFYGLKKASGEIAAVMDTDFNHNPRMLPGMLGKINGSDIVVGSRYVKGGGMENRLRNFFSKSYNRVIKLLLKLPTHDSLSGFFIIKRSKLPILLTEKIFIGYGDYFIRFLYKANKEGLKIREIPVYYKNRLHGESKSRFINMFFDYSKTVLDLLRNK